MKHSTLLTGVGVCGAFGAGRQALAAALARGSMPVSVVESIRLPGAPPRTLHAALANWSALREWVSPMEARRMSPPSRLAVAAARQAVADAELTPSTIPTDRAAVTLGTSYGCVSYAARLLDEAHEIGWESASPSTFTETVANVHAGQIALALQLKGPNFTYTQREASALTALTRAHALCRGGTADVVLTGVVDEMHPIMLTILDRFRLIAGERGLPPRPFDSRSSGCLAAEGACVLVAEPEPLARARGVVGGVRVLGIARANDPSASAIGWGCEPTPSAAALRTGLNYAGIELESIHRVFSGASGVPEADRMEHARLEAAFCGSIPPITTPKSVTGEYGGGFLAAAVISLAPGERALVTNAAVGGVLVWAVLERVA